MASGCYRLGRAASRVLQADRPRHLPALRRRDRRSSVPTAARPPSPQRHADWTAGRGGDSFTLPSGRHALRDARRHARAFRLSTAPRGCAAYPEAGIDVSGARTPGVTPYQEVRGYVDAHTHGMAFEFLGGDVHCGKPWHQYGAPYALVDCPDHTATGGNGARARVGPVRASRSHDPVGWPTFKDWPAPDSLTHEGTYYRWLERSWRGGQRIFVNLLVENNQLCELYPLKRRTPATTWTRSACRPSDMYQMQDYIDAQFGGPGKGFYRIVTNPFQARQVINAGKMAVVMGIETSVPFGCTFKTCPAATARAATPRRHRPPARRGAHARRAADGAGQQVRQRARRRRRRQRRGRRGRQRRELPRDRLASGTCGTASRPTRGPRQATSSPRPTISAEQQDALFGAIGELFGPAGPAGAAGLPAARPLQPPRPDHAGRAHDRGPGRRGTCSSTPTT